MAKGITINGLPIVLKRPGYLDIENLDLYYEDCVIGGRGSFMVPIRERSQFVDATRNKLLQEIAGNEPLEVAGQARPGPPAADVLPCRRAPMERPDGELIARAG